jgi:hypothetical protein
MVGVPRQPKEALRSKLDKALGVEQTPQNQRVPNQAVQNQTVQKPQTQNQPAENQSSQNQPA